MPARALKVGVQLPEVEWEARWPDLRALALRAEELGFDSIWYGDHLLYRRPGDDRARGPWEAWTMLAGLAAVTSRITLGPLVAATAFHAPAMLAKMAATVDEISGGRLVLGLGAGWNEVEFAGLRLPVRPPHQPLRGGVHDHSRTLLRDGLDRLRGRVLHRARLRAGAAAPAGRPTADDRLVGSADARDRGAARGCLERLVRRLREPTCRDRTAPRAGRRRGTGGRARPVRDRADGGAAGAPARGARPCLRRSGRRGGHPAGGGAARGDRRDACGRSPPRGSATSSWSSTRSRSPRSTRSRRCWRTWTAAEPGWGCGGRYAARHRRIR